MSRPGAFLRKHLMSQYEGLFAGRPAAVLGGGPSLPGDMARLPDGCVLIAVNYHAFHLCEPDFMVYNDAPDSDPVLWEAVRKPGRAVRVSQDSSSDVEFDVPVWTGFYSSNTAAWFGLWLGCDPVILCGMDCYQGNEVYFHEYNRDYDPPCWHYPLEDHLRPWKEDGKNLLPHVERVRVMSGPLGTVFPRWEDPTPTLPIRKRMEREEEGGRR